jgi:hypothetical protein
MSEILDRNVLEHSDVLSKLTRDIEALSDGPVTWSRGALTPRRTQHTVFVNGEITLEGAERPLVDANVETLAQMTLEAVKAHRGSIEGPVGLVWRIEPELHLFGDRLQLYTRLCFEPSLTQVAPGVWVETRMTESFPWVNR